MTFEKAIIIFCQMYGRALTTKGIQKPIAWALYHTWQQVDTLEKPIDKQIIIDKAKIPATYDKCGSCKWLDLSQKSSIGYVCKNPGKEWRHKTSMYHAKSARACKKFEKGAEQ